MQTSRKLHSKQKSLTWSYNPELEDDLCRPGIEHVGLKCSGDLIEVELKNIIFDHDNDITVNE